MAYTPELSLRGSATLRRLAWFMGAPMPRSLEFLVEVAAMKTSQMKPGAVCEFCRDKSKCSICAFNPSESTTKDEKAEEVMSYGTAI